MNCTKLAGPLLAAAVIAGCGDGTAPEGTAAVEAPLTSPTVEFLGGSGSGSQFFASALPAPAGLMAFVLRYADGDHHVKTIQAQQGRVGLFDNTTRQFNWTWKGIQLPPGSIPCWTEYAGEGGDQVAWGGPEPLCHDPAAQAGYVPVLTGFMTSYPTDHHIWDLRVDVPWPGHQAPLTGVAWIGDISSHLSTSAFLSYALVPAANVKSVNLYSGTSAGANSLLRIPETNPVLMGFRLWWNATSWWKLPPYSDHHLREVGVLLAPSWLYTSYRDNCEQDDYAWEVVVADLQ